MGRYDGEDGPDESGYVTSGMQDAVRRGYSPAPGYPGYPESRMYPVCTRCSPPDEDYRHPPGEGCKGVVGEEDRLRSLEKLKQRQKADAIRQAKRLLREQGYKVTK